MALIRSILDLKPYLILKNCFKKMDLSIMVFKVSVAIKKKVFTEYAKTTISKNFEMDRKMCIYIPPACKKKSIN